MSLMNDGIDSFESEIKTIIDGMKGVLNQTPSQNIPKDSDTATPFSIPLSKEDLKAFIGLCSLEEKPVKEKIAELMKDYIEEKRKQMKK